jgi:DNA-binding CsgD family transcriptional regulator
MCAGQSRALVLRGPSGIGKSALLEDTVARAGAMTVIRVSGVESEGEIAYAALYCLWPGVLAEITDRLSEPQRAALHVVFGVELGAAPDPLLVGLAVLTGLSEVAARRPLLVVVDDAQWLDDASARTLGFVARRSEADGVGLLFAAREAVGFLSGLPELPVSGLSPGAARALSGSAFSAPVDEDVLQRFIAETGGNPLALLELPRGMTASELTALLDRDDTRQLWVRLEESFRRRIGELDGDASTLLLIAAAEPVGDPLLFRRAAELLGVSAVAVDELGLTGLLDVGAKVTFRHPLVRSAAYRFAAPIRRRQIHEALAAVTDAEADPDRRAWHRGLAAAGPDESVAAELERSAQRAHARGGWAAAAAFLERSLTLTADARKRGPRALAAAEARLTAGDPDRTRELLDLAATSHLSEGDAARVDVVRARLAFALSSGGEAPALLLRAADRLAALGLPEANDTYLEAIRAAHFAGRLAADVPVRAVAQAVRKNLRPRPDHAGDEILTAFVAFWLDDYAIAAPVIQDTVKRLRGRYVRWPRALTVWDDGLPVTVWDDEAWQELAELQVRLVTDEGVVRALPVVLTERALAHAHAGEYGEAARLADKIAGISEMMGTAVPPYIPVLLAAEYGLDAEALALMEASLTAAMANGEGGAVTFIHLERAVLCNALGRYEEAWASASVAYEDPLGYIGWILPELIEAAARTGRHAEAAPAMDSLSQMAAVVRTDWLLGIEARSRALLSDDADAEDAYRTAVDHLQRSSARPSLARAHLIFGEWLRRQGRRIDAREQLRIAHGMFEAWDAGAFAQRAWTELLVTGERVRKRDAKQARDLTAQEARIAQLAARGLSNREIGAQLFISHRTVGYHLGKVFTKLGVGSRNQLHNMLDSDGP